jgi:hypothetical protein
MLGDGLPSQSFSFPAARILALMSSTRLRPSSHGAEPSMFAFYSPCRRCGSGRFRAVLLAKKASCIVRNGAVTGSNPTRSTRLVAERKAPNLQSRVRFPTVLVDLPRSAFLAI